MSADSWGCLDPTSTDTRMASAFDLLQQAAIAEAASGRSTAGSATTAGQVGTALASAVSRADRWEVAWATVVMDPGGLWLAGVSGLALFCRMKHVCYATSPFVT